MRHGMLRWRSMHNGGGPSDVAQTWHIASSTIVQQISEYCEKVLVNGTQVQ
jgi:hypothetical protein